jgi:hypothetical protein
VRTNHTIKINLRGGIITPTALYDILIAAKHTNVVRLTLGLRQQMFLEVHTEDYHDLKEGLNLLGVHYETDNDYHPNIISSYPAEGIFIPESWLRPDAYKSILKQINHQPRLKINISDSNQSFTPLLTGNINWVAAQTPDFWHLIVRFPKTNSMYEWDRLVHTNDVARMSEHLETLIFEHKDQFYDMENAKGELLMEKAMQSKYNTQPATAKAHLPAFNLPYYEGLNRYEGNQFWLGIYRRNEEFPINLMLDICKLCEDTNIAEICTTPWKTLIIKNIQEKDRSKWLRLLSDHLVNVRHAANELNFQVQDDDPNALELKNYLVKNLNERDIRTFGLCIGIKTKPKTEIFSSILIRRRSMVSLGALGLWPVYDILCAKDFNPNERTSFAFATGVSKFMLPEYLRRAILQFYKDTNDVVEADDL